jgi:hypothetical protein
MPAINDLLDLEEEEILFQLLQQEALCSLESRMPAGPREVIIQNCIAGHQHLMDNYFSVQPVYNDQMFQRCFWMSEDLFNLLCVDLQQHHCFWELKAVSTTIFLFKTFLYLTHASEFLFVQDCCGQIGLSPHQKITGNLATSVWSQCQLNG